MTHGVKITFYPSRITGTGPKGITILEAARRLGVNLDGPCGGTGRCGKDMVQVRTNKTLNTLLACKTFIEDDLEIVIPSCETGRMKTVERFYTDGVRINNINPAVRKEVVRNAGGHYCTNVYINDRLISAENGDTRALSYGVALDIGTTTLVASLVDLNAGKAMGCSSVLNPLVYYGHDVMSRIKYSVSQPDGLLRMHKELVSAVNLLIKVLSSERSVSPENIYQIIVAGNTTMQHIFLKKEIKGIGEYPYEAETLDAFTTAAGALGIDISGSASVTTFPCISAYVGGDIVSGLLAIDHKSLEMPALFLDIGTNGEMALLQEDRIVATSTAAGPCFEGMTISCGMRAGEGAIEHVSINEEIALSVIGGGTPRGICGSGLLDLVSELIRTCLVNSRGRLQGNDSKSPPKYKKYLFGKDGKRYLRLNENLSVSQDDIRQVQLAKAAISAGIEVILAECNVKTDDLKAVIIAGAFGYHIKKESLFGIGILQGLATARLSFVGNSSLEGAARLLLHGELLHSAVHIASASQCIELSQIPAFEEIFVRNIHF